MSTTATTNPVHVVDVTVDHVDAQQDTATARVHLDAEPRDREILAELLAPQQMTLLFARIGGGVEMEAIVADTRRYDGLAGIREGVTVAVAEALLAMAGTDRPCTA